MAQEQEQEPEEEEEEDEEEKHTKKRPASAMLKRPGSSVRKRPAGSKPKNQHEANNDADGTEEARDRGKARQWSIAMNAGRVPEEIVEAFTKANRTDKTAIINKVVEKGECGQYQLSFDNPVLTDISVFRCM